MDAASLAARTRDEEVDGSMAYRERTVPRHTHDDDDTVDVRTDDDTVVEDRPYAEDRPYRRDTGPEVARERYGGMHVGAQLVGMLTALALTLLLAGIVAAVAGSVAFETGLDEQLDATTKATEVAIGSVIAGIVVLGISFLVGGWAAGRMSRYDGGRNGLMTAVWFLVLGVVLAALGLWAGEEYNIAQRVDLLPNWFGTWFEADEVTIGAVISGVVAIAVMLLAGFLGGTLGERFHRRADEMIAAHESGGIVTERRVVER
jgi:hypothetical protein